MRRLLVIAAFGITIAGCQKSDQAADTAVVPPSKEAGASPRGGADESITPMTTTPAGVAPVGGTDSVAGGGSNQGQMIKDRAKGVGQNPTSADQLPSDGG